MNLRVKLTEDRFSSELALKVLLDNFLGDDEKLVNSVLPLLETITRRQLIKDLTESTTLHKWNTRVTSMLQSRQGGVRFAGICLSKASVDQNLQCLYSHGVVWTRLLLGFLGVCKEHCDWGQHLM